MISIKIGKYHMPTTKLTLFAVSKDEWYTKEDAGKPMKNALCTKSNSQAEMISSNKKNQARSLSHC